MRAAPLCETAEPWLPSERDVPRESSSERVCNARNVKARFSDSVQLAKGRVPQPRHSRGSSRVQKTSRPDAEACVRASPPQERSAFTCLVKAKWMLYPQRGEDTWAVTVARSGSLQFITLSHIWKLPKISPSALLIAVAAELAEPQEASVQHLVQK